jgi:hypothetical protein
MDSKSESSYESPEQYFVKRKDYIEHYYKEEAEQRAIRLKCLELAVSISPTGTNSDKLLEFSNKYYNWILNYGTTEQENGA